MHEFLGLMGYCPRYTKDQGHQLGSMLKCHCNKMDYADSWELWLHFLVKLDWRMYAALNEAIN